VQVAPVRDDPRLVERRPHRHAVVEGAEDRCRIFREPLRDVGVQPAAAIVERRGQIPVVERNEWLDVVGEELIDQPIVEREPARVDGAGAGREDPAPRDAEPIRVEADVAHEGDVLVISVVVVAGDVPGVAARGEAGRVSEAVPDARPCAVGERAAFYLVGGGRGTPEEAGREAPGLGGLVTHRGRHWSWRA
jgi:hypothetical protein